jgi:hypothetical protein
MIRRLLLVAAICSTTLSLGPVALAAGPQTDAEKAILKLDSDWADAEVRRDGAALERILDDRFIAIFGKAKPIDKQTFIKSILAEDPDKVVTQKLSDRSLIVDRDTAVLTEVDTETDVENGETKVATWRFTVTYIRRGGRWIALAEQGGATQP